MMTDAPSEPKRTTKATHPDLPPGLVLGPDGKPCKVCNSWQDWAKIKVKKKTSPSSTVVGATSAAAGAVAVSTSSPSFSTNRSDCPPDTAALGRATWTFLHTTAAYYPTNPTPSQQDRMMGLLSSLPALYPCTWCADDFGKAVKANPPDVSGRLGLSRWLCERHNEVNTKLGKGKFDCDWKTLDARWKEGPSDGSCD